MPEDAHEAGLKKNLGDLIDSLELSDLRKRFLGSRWVDQMLWFEGKAKQNQRRHIVLRLITIAAGVLVAALVGFSIRTESVTPALAWTTFTLSLAVAIAAALDSFFHYDARWRNYRRTAEALKSQGWLFLQLAGPYANFSTHSKAYPVFVSQIERLIQQDVEVYIVDVNRERQESDLGRG
jgi:hypothetical protein